MRLCFVGDSMVNGTGDPTGLGWTGRLCVQAWQQGQNLTYYNLGIRRETSADIRTRWEAEVWRRLPENLDGRVMFSFGVNDTTLEEGQPRVAIADSLTHTHAILRQAQSRFPVLMVGPPPIADEEQNTRIAQLSAALVPLCRSLHVPYLEIFPLLHRSALWMQEVARYDGAHPQAGGYEIWAQQVGQWQAWQDWLNHP